MDVQRSERGIQHVVDEREQRAENDFPKPRLVFSLALSAV